MFQWRSRIQVKHKKAIWMTHKAVKAVRRKHNLFSKHKDTSHPAYIKASCTERKEVKRAKRNFEAKLSKNITRSQSNLTKSASRGAHSPVRGHHRGSKFVPLNPGVGVPISVP